MTFYRRLLHVCETEPSAFLSWRLHDSLPPHQAFPLRTANSGRAFAATDRVLDQARGGSFHLRQPAVAGMVVEALESAANVLGYCRLHAFVVMPNHVHLLVTPAVPLAELTESLRTLTAARARAMLDLPEGSFWHEESYVRMVRYEREFDEIRNYIEEDPVRAGLVREAREYLWSSAGRMPQGLRPASSRDWVTIAC
jgi:REP element-mobilizing transposase RayT